MKFARVEDGRVTAVIELDHRPLFEEAEQARWREVEASSEIVAGWVVAGDALAPPAPGPWPPPAPQVPVDLVAYARHVRWRAEVGGMIWQNVPIATDDSSKIKIAGARLAAEANPAFETTWWGADGEGVVVDAALIIQLSDAVLAHVDSTFTTFGLVKAGIENGTITSREEIDAVFGAARR